MVTSVEHFSQVVASIYDAAVSPHGWEQALADTCRVLGAEGGGMLGGDTSFWAIQDAAMPEHVTTAYTEHYHRLDPVMPTLLNGPRGRIYVHAEVIAPYRRGEFYADWMRPNAIEDGLFVRLTDGPRSSFTTNRRWRCTARCRRCTIATPTSARHWTRSGTASWC